MFSTFYRIKLQGIDKYVTSKKIKSAFSSLEGISVEQVRKLGNKNFADVFVISGRGIESLKSDIANSLKIKASKTKIREIEDKEEIEYYLGRKNRLEEYDDESVKAFLKKIAKRRKVTFNQENDMSMKLVEYRENYVFINVGVEKENNELSFIPDKTLDVPEEVLNLSKSVILLIKRMTDQMGVTVYSRQDSVNGAIKGFSLKYFKGKSMVTLVLSDQILDEVDLKYIKELIISSFEGKTVFCIGINNSLNRKVEDCSRIEVVTKTTNKMEIEGEAVTPASRDKFEFFSSPEFKQIAGDSSNIQLVNLFHKDKATENRLLVHSLKPTNLFDYILAAKNLKIEENFRFERLNEMWFCSLVTKI